MNSGNTVETCDILLNISEILGGYKRLHPLHLKLWREPSPTVSPYVSASGYCVHCSSNLKEARGNSIMLILKMFWRQLEILTFVWNSSSLWVKLNNGTDYMNNLFHP